MGVDDAGLVPGVGLVDLGRLLDSGRVSLREVHDFYASRIDRYDPLLGAFVHQDEEATARELRRAEGLRTRGREYPPFTGLPIGLKDLHEVRGQPSRRASLAVESSVATRDDPFAAGLRAQGFVFMGRTASPELGIAPVTESPLHGITRNPWNPERSPAGSSGGSAAAVAAGLVPMATGTDSGGSIRMPAAATGLVGLTATPGRLPGGRQGVVNVVPGFLTRTVRDTRALFEAFGDAPARHGADPGSPGTPDPPLAGLRVGLLVRSPLSGVVVDPQVAAAARDVARTLATLGADVHELGPAFLEYDEVLGLRAVLDATSLRMSPVTWPDRLQPFLRALWDSYEEYTLVDYARASEQVQAASRRIASHWRRDFDVLVSPTLAARAPEVGETLRAANDSLDHVRAFSPYLAFTGWVNTVGLPAISLPTHVDSEGMPIGVQLVGDRGSDGELMRLASALEAEYHWEARFPAAFVP